MNGTDLLAEFRVNGSQEAFSELVRRYTNLVYSVAKRRLSNVSFAEEVTQTVFIRLAKTVPELRSDAELVAWLHRTTVHASIDLWRAESRRRAREEHAIAMQPAPQQEPSWNDVAPALDESLNELNETDRQTLLLRFFSRASMRDLGHVFGVSEDAAKMRVSRALDRLRVRLACRGVRCAEVALAALLIERAVEAAPAALVLSLGSLKFPVRTTVGTAAGLLTAFRHASKAKLIAGAVAPIVLISVVTVVFLRSENQKTQVDALDDALTASAIGSSSQSSVAITSNAETAAADGQPDPLKLLQVVAQARQRITSGSIEFQIAMEHVHRAQNETNVVILKTIFDGHKRRSESVGREYAYTMMGENAAEISDAKIQALGLDREGAVREGLLEGFGARYVTAYDGANLLRYRERGGRPDGTTIADPAEGSSTYVFDPRCVGLTTFLSPNATVENSLGYNEAKSVKLMGQETVEGSPAWHVQVRSKYDQTLAFWLAVDNPERVIKHTRGHDVVVSRYDNAGPLPEEVTIIDRANGTHRYTQRIVQTKAELNVPVSPAAWTLAGLGMPIGTDVSDSRIMRRVGYWTGIGLSERLPSKTDAPTQPPPDLTELLALMEKDPTSRAALDAAAWILLNNADGPEVEKAAELVLQHHIERADLTYLCGELERVRHRSAKKLLQAVLDKNPHTAVQATACFSLGTILKDEAKYGENKQATAEAEKYFEHLIPKLSHHSGKEAELANRAAPELSELRRLMLGKPAPEFEGEDLNGKTIKLSDHRGKVVLLYFWSNHYDDAVEHRKLLERFSGKPFALITVACAARPEKTDAAVEKHQITWPVIRDGQEGPIRTLWNANSWPTTYILDAQGIIRHRNPRGRTLDAINALVGQ